MMKERVALLVAVGVFLMWMAAGFTALKHPDATQTLVIITAPFGGVCGYLFGTAFIRRAANGRTENEGK